MIVEMKKITIAMLAEEASQGLATLGALGVVHILPLQEPESKAIMELRGRVDVCEKAVDILISRKARRTSKPMPPSPVTVGKVLAVARRRDRYRARLEAVRNDMEVVKPLDEFQPSDLQLLKEGGLFAKIYRCPKRELRKTEFPETDTFVVGGGGSERYILALSRREFSLPFKQIEVPAMGLHELEREAKKIKKVLAAFDAQLDRYAASVPELKHEAAALDGGLAFAEAVAGMGREGPISYLAGYVPADDLEPLKAKAQAKGWALMLEEPSDVSEVPTLIKNPAWIGIIKPVFSLMGAFPGYDELDVSFWFLLAT